MMYNKIIEDCFFEPRHIGRLDLALPHTVCATAGQKGQKAVFALYMQCDDRGFIRASCFKAMGTPYLIAALEFLCRLLEGRNLDDLPEAGYQVLVDALEIPVAQYPAAVQVDTVYKELLLLMKRTFERNGL